MIEKIKRRTPSKAEILEILVRQGTDLQGFTPPRAATKEAKLFALVLAHIGRVPCGKFEACGTWITAKKDCRRDHTIPLRQVPAAMRAEYDRPCNQRYLCISCDKRKTFRRGHNSAGLSDATLNAKLRRLEKRADPAYTTKEKRKWPKRKLCANLKKGSQPWPKGRKLQSRPFQPKEERRPWPRQP